MQDYLGKNQKNDIEKFIEGFENLIARVAELTRLENQLYGRDFKTRDHILAFLSAGNVSTAKIMVDGSIEDLDKRPDKPMEKDCELAEAAKEINKLLKNLNNIGNTESAVHAFSEVGDVIYNIIQLYNLEDLPNASYVKANILNLFTNHNQSRLIFITFGIAVQKFSIRYEMIRKKNVELEESLLSDKYGKFVEEIINEYGGLDRLLYSIRQILFDCLTVSINAATGDEYMLSQITTTSKLLSDIIAEI